VFCVEGKRVYDLSEDPLGPDLPFNPADCFVGGDRRYTDSESKGSASGDKKSA